MRTQKQIAASRENGRQSHGATTPEGKACIVSANLLSGIFAETPSRGGFVSYASESPRNLFIRNSVTNPRESP